MRFAAYKRMGRAFHRVVQMLRASMHKYIPGWAKSQDVDLPDDFDKYILQHIQTNGNNGGLVESSSDEDDDDYYSEESNESASESNESPSESNESSSDDDGGDYDEDEDDDDYPSD